MNTGSEAQHLIIPSCVSGEGVSQIGGHFGASAGF